MLGLDKGRTGTLTVRKTARGVQVDGEAPDRHLFPRKFLERELNKAVRIQVIVPAEQPLVYEVTGFDGPDLVASRLQNPTPLQPKRRWWQRKNRG